jgi:hypothetical protein
MANDLFNQNDGFCAITLQRDLVDMYNYPDQRDFGFTFTTPATFSGGTITIEFKIGINCGQNINRMVYLNDKELRSISLNPECYCVPDFPQTFIFTATSNELVGGGGVNTLRISSQNNFIGFSPVAGPVYAIITYSA